MATSFIVFFSANVLLSIFVPRRRLPKPLPEYALVLMLATAAWGLYAYTEGSRPSIWPLCQARSSRSSSATCPAAKVGYLVCNRANKVEEKVIDNEDSPWPDSSDTKEKLEEL